ncbi:hypothetical protein D9756_007356 [Leucocoprinus leucothites]|uniref:Uncharacterized protein n=1 Tax=Leucocoprinus leucothites TaxID=201217 RepID=A0A8H5D5F4_9AGAR|nr:hypothetical protein D9756_007356 [Leucoagaricus leucothites]
MLDYESASATLGRPGNTDLRLGLATAPALYAWEEFPKRGTLIGCKFESSGDVEKVIIPFILASSFTASFTAPVSISSLHYLTPTLFQVCNLVHQSSAISQTEQLTQVYANEAKDVLQELPHSEGHDMLEVFTEHVVGRKN